MDLEDKGILKIIPLKYRMGKNFFILKKKRILMT